MGSQALSLSQCRQPVCDKAWPKIGSPCQDNFSEATEVATRADLVFEKYVNGFGCKHRSVMVCKSCGASEMERVTITVTEEGFQVWCFDAGRIKNPVSSFLAALDRHEEMWILLLIFAT